VDLDQFRIGRTHMDGGHYQQQRNDHEQCCGPKADRDLDVAEPVIDQGGQHGRGHGQQDRQDDEMIKQIGHGYSRPFTWSVPVKPRDASITTRNSAVMAKPMTMAVSTRACGTGSAYAAGSVVTRSRIGAASMRRRPMLKMKRLTA